MLRLKILIRISFFGSHSPEDLSVEVVSMEISKNTFGENFPDDLRNGHPLQAIHVLLRQGDEQQAILLRLSALYLTPFCLGLVDLSIQFASCMLADLGKVLQRKTDALQLRASPLPVGDEPPSP